MSFKISCLKPNQVGICEKPIVEENLFNDSCQTINTITSFTGTSGNLNISSPTGYNSVPTNWIFTNPNSLQTFLSKSGVFMFTITLGTDYNMLTINSTLSFRTVLNINGINPMGYDFIFVNTQGTTETYRSMTYNFITTLNDGINTVSLSVNNIVRLPPPSRTLNILNNISILRLF